MCLSSTLVLLEIMLKGVEDDSGSVSVVNEPRNSQVTGSCAQKFVSIADAPSPLDRPLECNTHA